MKFVDDDDDNDKFENVKCITSGNVIFVHYHDQVWYLWIGTRLDNIVPPRPVQAGVLPVSYTHLTLPTNREV